MIPLEQVPAVIGAVVEGIIIGTAAVAIVVAPFALIAWIWSGRS